MSEEGNESGSWEHDQINHTMLKRICPKQGHCFPLHNCLGKTNCVLDTPAGHGRDTQVKTLECSPSQNTNLTEGMVQYTKNMKVNVLVTGSCLTLRLHRLQPPGSSVHGILQAKILEPVAIPFSRGSFRPKDQTGVFCIASGFFTISHQGSPVRYGPRFVRTLHYDLSILDGPEQHGS